MHVALLSVDLDGLCCNNVTHSVVHNMLAMLEPNQYCVSLWLRQLKATVLLHNSASATLVFSLLR
jgi:hypothetical protein